LKNGKRRPEANADNSFRLHLHTWDDEGIERTSYEDTASSQFANKISELYRSSCLVCVTPRGRAYNMAQARDEAFNNGHREFHVYEQRRGRSKKRKLDPNLDFRKS